MTPHEAATEAAQDALTCCGGTGLVGDWPCVPCLSEEDTVTTAYDDLVADALDGNEPPLIIADSWEALNRPPRTYVSPSAGNAAAGLAALHPCHQVTVRPGRILADVDLPTALGLAARHGLEERGHYSDDARVWDGRWQGLRLEVRVSAA